MEYGNRSTENENQKQYFNQTKKKQTTKYEEMFRQAERTKVNERIKAKRVSGRKKTKVGVRSRL